MEKQPDSVRVRARSAAARRSAAASRRRRRSRSPPLQTVAWLVVFYCALVVGFYFAIDRIFASLARDADASARSEDERARAFEATKKPHAQ